MSGRPRAALNISKGERADLRTLQRSRKASPPVRKRADVVLACADGSTDVAVARHLGVSAQMVGMWRRRYMEGGLDSLEDKGRSGRPRGVTASDVGRVVALTLLSSPDDSRRWTIQSMVERSGLSHRGCARNLEGLGHQAGLRRLARFDEAALGGASGGCGGCVHQPIGAGDGDVRV